MPPRTGARAPPTLPAQTQAGQLPLEAPLSASAFFSGKDLSLGGSGQGHSPVANARYSALTVVTEIGTKQMGSRVMEAPQNQEEAQRVYQENCAFYCQETSILKQQCLLHS